MNNSKFINLLFERHRSGFITGEKLQVADWKTPGLLVVNTSQTDFDPSMGRIKLRFHEENETVSLPISIQHTAKPHIMKAVLRLGQGFPEERRQDVALLNVKITPTQGRNGCILGMSLLEEKPFYCVQAFSCSFEDATTRQKVFSEQKGGAVAVRIVPGVAMKHLVGICHDTIAWKIKVPIEGPMRVGPNEFRSVMELALHLAKSPHYTDTYRNLPVKNLSGRLTELATAANEAAKYRNESFSVSEVRALGIRSLKSEMFTV